MRILGATTDLHAADAQYYELCYKKFTNIHNVKAAVSSNTAMTEDPSVAEVITTMLPKPNHIWASVELHKLCMDITIERDSYPDNMIGRRQLISKLTGHFGDSLVELHINGCASLLCFKKHLPENLHIV